jgi:RimJ/RimL family protein N-acetyltransferase
VNENRANLDPGAAMEIVTERLVLRELALGDAERANLYESDPRVVRYQSHGVRTLEESRDYIARVIEETAASSPRRLFDLAMTLQGSGLYIGRVGLHVTSEEDRSAALWYVLDPSCWGKGLTVEAARALLDFAFRERGLHRVWVDCDPRNVASVRVAEKLGMRREAHLVENAWIKGEWTDALIFAVLDREWLAKTPRG